MTGIDAILQDPSVLVLVGVVSVMALALAHGLAYGLVKVLEKKHDAKVQNGHKPADDATLRQVRDAVRDLQAEVSEYRREWSHYVGALGDMRQFHCRYDPDTGRCYIDKGDRE